MVPDASMSLEVELVGLAETARPAIARTADPQALEELRISYLGRKEGRLTLILRRLPEVAEEERPRIGQLANRLKTEISALLDQRRAELEHERAAAQAAGPDLTLPGRTHWIGTQHPITRTMAELVGICVRMGFREELGSEIEDDWHNFTALNFKPDHPARDIWAGFYLPGDRLLRSHTSPVQIRVMERRPPPVRIVAPGRCYRPDPFDAAGHAPVFHQVEGLYVDEGVSMAHLKGVLDGLVREFFGPGVVVKFGPSYFPFTEPSAEIAATCAICRGPGCPTCKGTGWLELGGCGMVHPHVLRNVGYDPERYTGYAFGIGVERFAMIKYRIDDIRLFFENDIRFLKQF
jgi:phenylalanyl-tRNA synthetase alpha chain